ncbi:hypothetical protein, partial [Rhizobium sp. LCM 4573]|uniref:hypothetical protein n=1 Tax=Rhizobium sp. LCM 4573 TaxID=1848291 RepID=UPI001A7E162B
NRSQSACANFSVIVSQVVQNTRIPQERETSSPAAPPPSSVSGVISGPPETSQHRCFQKSKKSNNRLFPMGKFETLRNFAEKGAASTAFFPDRSRRFLWNAPKLPRQIHNLVVSRV